MIRNFKFSVEDQTYGAVGDDVESEIIIDDSEFGMYWLVDGKKFRLSSQNVRDLKVIIAQVELAP